MRKRMFFVLASLVQVAFSFAQTDSIVSLNNLRFHSEREKRAYTNFVHFEKDTLEAFLAVDDILTGEDYNYLEKKFERVWEELLAKKIESKKVNAQIKLVYSAVKKNFLLTYVQEEFLSSTLLSGRYNENTATILLAMLLDRLHIPYLMSDSFVDFYIIANPGENEQKLFVGDPNKVNIQQSDEFKKQYVDFLRKSGTISELEMRSHTYAEHYEKISKVQKNLTLKELLGMHYYIQSCREQRLEDVAGSLDLSQKAFYLNQIPYVQMQFLGCLYKKMEQFTVSKASDIDYLVQLHRVGNLDAETTSNIFRNIISNQKQYTDRELLCDSLYQRFRSKISSQLLLDELEYDYNLMMIDTKEVTWVDMYRLDRAACIKPNLKQINDYLENIIRVNIYKLHSSSTRLDSIKQLSNQLKSATSLETLRNQRQITLLDLAKEAYKNKSIKEGEQYLTEFERNCSLPIGNEWFKSMVEQAYREMAVSVYWCTNQDVESNHKIVQRGLRLVPSSEIIKSGRYDKGYVKYENTNPVVKYLKKEEKDKKPKTGRTIRVISKDKKEKVYSF